MVDHGTFGDLTLNADGSYSYVAGTKHGTDNFSYTVSDGQGGTTLATLDVTNPCYCRGTRILTTRGEVAVEDLCIGDHVMTFPAGDGDGSLVARPVRWIGQRRIDLTRHLHRDRVQPIRIWRDAVGPGAPHPRPAGFA